MSKTDEIMQKVTAEIIASIEAGIATGAWVKPWKNTGMPTNASTGKHYLGGNAFYFMLVAEANGYTSSLWATYKQWQSLGAQVRKGERGTYGVKWVAKTAKNDEGKTVATGGMFPTTFSVFHVEQVEGYDVPEAEGLDDGQRIARAEAFFASIDASVHHGGDSAYYSPAADRIVTPAFSAFVDPAAYYSTLAHEFTHWTGAKNRLARDFSGRFGSDEYAVEELVAELGAALLCGHLGIEDRPRQDHAEYLAHWLRVLRADAKALWTAASAASKAAGYLIEVASPE